MSSRWSSSSGRPIETNPTSSAPASRHRRRSRSASSTFGGAFAGLCRCRITVGCSSSFAMVIPQIPDSRSTRITIVYIQLRVADCSLARAERSAQEAGFPNPSREAICWRAASPSSPIKSLASAWAFSHDGWILARSFVPWGVSRIVWLRPPVGGSDSSQPFLLHELHVPAEGRLLDPQDPGDIGGPALAQMGDGRQDIRLADPQRERAAGLRRKGP